MSDLINNFLDVNNTFFTIFGYSISYLEFVGTLFTLAGVLLVARRKVISWPVGLVGVILFGILFYEIELYADFFEQIFYFITGVWGWLMWSKIKENKKEIPVTRNSKRTNIYWLLGIGACSSLVSVFLFNIHTLIPQLFPEPASFVVIDASTTVASFAAQILLMKRKLESWWLWIAVNIIAIVFYWYKEVPFISLLYVIFLVNAIYALFEWGKSMRSETNELTE